MGAVGRNIRKLQKDTLKFGSVIGYDESCQRKVDFD